MSRLQYFDYIRVAKESQIPSSELRKMEVEVKQEFPNDRMMFELHMLRYVRSKAIVMKSA